MDAPVQGLRSRANNHGARATPGDDSRGRHGRFPHPGPLPEGEGDAVRLRRDFHRNPTPFPAYLQEEPSRGNSRLRGEIGNPARIRFARLHRDEDPVGVAIGVPTLPVHLHP